MWINLNKESIKGSSWGDTDSETLNVLQVAIIHDDIVNCDTPSVIASSITITGC